jgi:hypothetical protein
MLPGEIEGLVACLSSRKCYIANSPRLLGLELAEHFCRLDGPEPRKVGLEVVISGLFVKGAHVDLAGEYLPDVLLVLSAIEERADLKLESGVWAYLFAIQDVFRAIRATSFFDCGKCGEPTGCCFFVAFDLELDHIAILLEVGQHFI